MLSAQSILRWTVLATTTAALVACSDNDNNSKKDGKKPRKPTAAQAGKETKGELEIVKFLGELEPQVKEPTKADLEFTNSIYPVGVVAGISSEGLANCNDTEGNACDVNNRTFIRNVTSVTASFNIAGTDYEYSGTFSDYNLSQPIEFGDIQHTIVPKLVLKVFISDLNADRLALVIYNTADQKELPFAAFLFKRDEKGAFIPVEKLGGGKFVSTQQFQKSVQARLGREAASSTEALDNLREQERSVAAMKEEISQFNARRMALLTKYYSKKHPNLPATEWARMAREEVKRSPSTSGR